MISFMLSYMESYILRYHVFNPHFELNEQGAIVFRLEYKIPTPFFTSNIFFLQLSFSVS